MHMHPIGALALLALLETSVVFSLGFALGALWCAAGHSRRAAKCPICLQPMMGSEARSIVS